MAEMGKSLIFIGIIIIIIGTILLFNDKLPFNLGKLPGDISYKERELLLLFPDHHFNTYQCCSISFVLSI